MNRALRCAAASPCTRTLASAALLVALAAALAGCVSSTRDLSSGRTPSPVGTAEPATSSASSADLPPTDPFVRAFAVVRPSVVLFTMKLPSDDPKHRREFDEAYGSGLVVASGPWGSQILTEQHVIDGAEDLRVKIGARKSVPARVVAANADLDLALVDVRTPNLPAAALGSDAKLQAGEAIGVAGYPVPDDFADDDLGTGVSVYAGRLASIRNDALELEAPVIPGESGGPVFDAHSGIVIGLAESRFDDEHAIGFAIPVDDARRFLHGRLRAPLPAVRRFMPGAAGEATASP
ncbi:MAG: S1C family serine protease [Vulcanimicrobiaceae bacterium]